MQASITLVRRSWATSHSDVLRRYLRAQAEASRWLNDPAHKTEAIAILASALKSTPAESAESYDAYVHSHFFTNDFCQLRPGMAAVLKMMHDQGRTQSTAADLAKYVDPQWCPKAS
jgi:ABC-type nitrate/sulfonate/bicarbonate transport system substrate-binding protein